MGAHRYGRNKEAGRDLVRGQALFHGLQDLPLPVGQLGRAPADQRDPPSPLALAELLDQEGNKPPRQGRLPFEHTAQREGQPRRVDVLQEVAGRTRTECVEEVLIGARDGQHHDRRIRELVGDRLGRPDAIPGHVNVEQADVGLLTPSSLDGTASVRRLRAHDEAAPLKSGLDAGTRRRMVIRDENADYQFFGHSRTSTAVPRPITESTEKSAPRASARSFMVTSPKPSAGASFGSKPTPSSSTRK